MLCVTSAYVDVEVSDDFVLKLCRGSLGSMPSVVLRRKRLSIHSPSIGLVAVSFNLIRPLTHGWMSPTTSQSIHQNHPRSTS